MANIKRFYNYFFIPLVAKFNIITADQLSDAEVLAPRLIGTCIRHLLITESHKHYTNYSASQFYYRKTHFAWTEAILAYPLSTEL